MRDLCCFEKEKKKENRENTFLSNALESIDSTYDKRRVKLQIFVSFKKIGRLEERKKRGVVGRAGKSASSLLVEEWEGG